MVFSLAGLGTAINSGANTYNSVDSLIAQMRGQQAQQAALKQALARIAAQQQGGNVPPQPGMPPQPGGVSPTGGAMSPAMGAPGGGAGPLPAQGGAPASMTQQPSQGGAPIGLQDAYLQALVSGNSSPRAMNWALQNGMKSLQAPASNATRLEIAAANNAQKNENQRLNREERLQLQNNIIASRSKLAGAEQKNGGLRNDPTYQALKQEAVAANSANTAAGNSDDTLKALNDANKALLDYAVNKKLPSGYQTAPASTGATPPAATGASAPSQEDLEFTAKQNNMTVDQVKQKLGIQ